MAESIGINACDTLSSITVQVKVKDIKKFSCKLWLGGIILKIAGWVLHPVKIELLKEDA